jgi:hypothetical protein
MSDATQPTSAENAGERIHGDGAQVQRARRLTIATIPRAGGRWRVGVPLALAVAAAAITSAALATGSGAAQSRAEGVSNLLSQVRTSFGDGRILSASASASTLSVKLAVVPRGPSLVKAIFEARVLANATSDWMRRNGQKPIAAVLYLDASGTPLQDSPPGGDRVGTNPSVAPLTAGACNSAAHSALQSAPAETSLTVQSVRTLPFLRGTCVVEFRTSDPSEFASDAPLAIGTFAHAMGDPNNRAFLVLVDDESGRPQFATSWVPGEYGETWIERGLSRAFVLAPPRVRQPTAGG